MKKCAQNVPFQSLQPARMTEMDGLRDSFSVEAIVVLPFVPIGAEGRSLGLAPLKVVDIGTPLTFVAELPGGAALEVEEEAAVECEGAALVDVAFEVEPPGLALLAPEKLEPADTARLPPFRADGSTAETAWLPGCFFLLCC